MRLLPLGGGDILGIAGIMMEALPARHTVPALGYAVRGAKGRWIYCGDTEGLNPTFWHRVNALHEEQGGVAALCVETAFSNGEAELARRFRHLPSTALPPELAALQPGADMPIYITHAKSQESGHIMQEVWALEQGAWRCITDLQTVDALDV